MIRKKLFNKVLSVLMGTMMLVSVVDPTMVKAETNGVVEKEITIFHTNDVHSRVDNYAKVKAYIDGYENKLLLDAGDTFHGQSIATLEYGSSIAKILKAMGYVATVPGNHDFNYGQDRLLELGEESGVKILASNVKSDGIAKYDEYTIEEVNGVKIGIFGIATPETAYKTNPNNVIGLDFGDIDSITKDAERMVEVLENQGADVIVALSHLGIDSDSEVKATDIAKAVDGIDLIIDGHSHSILENYEEFNKTSDTKVTSTGEYLNNFGQVEITLDENLEIKDINLQTINTEELTEEDDTITELIEGIKEGQEEILNEVVGSTPIDLDGARTSVRYGHTNLGRLIASAMIDETGADVAITNGGGIRDSIKAGDITKNDIIKVLPFGNYIVTKKVKGSDIVAALNHGMVVGAGSFTHFGGMVAETEIITDEDGVTRHNVLSIKINGEEIDLDKEYVVATNDFMAVGGDDYTMFANYPTLNEYSALDEALINFIEKIGSEEIINISNEERLIVKEAADEEDNNNQSENDEDSEDQVTGEEESNGTTDGEESKDDTVVESKPSTDNNETNIDNNDSKEESTEKLPQTGNTVIAPIFMFAVVMVASGVYTIRGMAK